MELGSPWSLNRMMQLLHATQSIYPDESEEPGVLACFDLEPLVEELGGFASFDL